MREDEYRGMERRFIPPPSLPVVVLPWAALRTEFIAPHDFCADIVGEIASAVVVEPLRSPGHGPVGPVSGGARPEEKRTRIGMTEWAIEALTFPRAVSIAGHREVLDADQL